MYANAKKKEKRLQYFVEKKYLPDSNVRLRWVSGCDTGIPP